MKLPEDASVRLGLVWAAVTGPTVGSWAQLVAWPESSIPEKHGTGSFARSLFRSEEHSHVPYPLGSSCCFNFRMKDRLVSH